MGAEFILILIFVALLLLVALSPLESLTWWAGWFGGRQELNELELGQPLAVPVTHGQRARLPGVPDRDRRLFGKIVSAA
jgi:hypothetical protein